MKTIPIYKFFATAFNYVTGDQRRSQQFGFAVNMTYSLLLKTFSERCIPEINNGKTHPLVEKFIKNAVTIAYKEYECPFDRLVPQKNNIIINNGFRISFKCILDQTGKKIIMLNFGREGNLNQETGALIGLINEFQLSNPMPVGDFKQICYWCLNSGKEVCISLDEVVPLPRNKILEVLETIANSNIL